MLLGTLLNLRHLSYSVKHCANFVCRDCTTHSIPLDLEVEHPNDHGEFNSLSDDGTALLIISLAFINVPI